LRGIIKTFVSSISIDLSNGYERARASFMALFAGTVANHPFETRWSKSPVSIVK
jgi:hypothetical protein